MSDKKIFSDGDYQRAVGGLHPEVGGIAPPMGLSINQTEAFNVSIRYEPDR